MSNYLQKNDPTKTNAVKNMQNTLTFTYYLIVIGTVGIAFATNKYGFSNVYASSVGVGFLLGLFVFANILVLFQKQITDYCVKYVTAKAKIEPKVNLSLDEIVNNFKKTETTPIVISPLTEYLQKHNDQRIVIEIIHDTNKSDYFSSGDNSISQKTFSKIQETLSQTSAKDIDIILNTNGGDLLSTKAICEALLTYKSLNPENKIRVYVPFKATSGGTFITFVADELYLNDYAVLSPVDPQIQTFFGTFGRSDLSATSTNNESTLYNLFAIYKSNISRSYELTLSMFARYRDSKAPTYSKHKDLFLTSGRLHSDYFTVGELKQLDFKIDGTVDQDIMKIYKNSFEKPKKSPSSLDSLLNVFGM